MKSTRSFYNRISILYPVIDFFLKRHRKRLIDAVNSEPPGNLLEVGVGSGSHLQLYKHHCITGIDISESMLHLAEQYKSPENVLMLMDGEHMKFDDGSFDFVVMCHVLAVVGDPDQLLTEAHRVLRPGGMLFILNHFTPAGFLSLVDRISEPVASLFHFRSRFYLSDLNAFQHFHLKHKIALGIGSYFQILIYTKP